MATKCCIAMLIQQLAIYVHTAWHRNVNTAWHRDVNATVCVHTALLYSKQ